MTNPAHLVLHILHLTLCIRPHPAYACGATNLRPLLQQRYGHKPAEESTDTVGHDGEPAPMRL